MIRLHRCVLLLLCIAGLFSGQKALGQHSDYNDSIFMYNGQILIGEINSVSLGVMNIDDIDLKSQNVKLYKIRRLSMPHLFKVETIGRQIYYSLIRPSPKDGWIELETTPGHWISLSITDLYTVISLDRDFFKRLNGSLAAGFSFTKSSGIGQVNLNATVKFATKLVDYQLTASEIGSIDTSKFSRDNESLELFAGIDISPTYFIAAAAQYQRNLELSIARRYSVLLGLGNKLIIRPQWQLVAVSGVQLSQELSTAGENSGVLFELPLMFRFNLYTFNHPNIQISTSQTAYLGLTQFGRFRYDGSTNFSWELIRYFYLTISPYTNFDSRPPTGNTSKFDYGIVFNISYKF